MNPPPGVSPPSTFSITHRSDGSAWLPDAEEVTAAIMRLSNNRSPGPSGIPVDFFKLTADFTDDLVELFGNLIETQSSSPTFSNCRLILLHKAGLISEPKNYRPINLTETGFRIFESLLKNRLQNWSESILHQDQYGFRANQSCMSALFRIITSLHAAIAQGTPLFMCFLDAVKAFDRVPHAAIMEAFIAHGLCPASCRLLHSVISDHVSSVFNSDDPAASIKILIECGVLQGGILSPLFFNIFADSILTNPSFLSMQALYADDRTVIDTSSTQLQESLLLLQEWASTRNLLHDGNELLVVNSPPPELHIHGKPIPITLSAKCLGLTIWNTGKIERADLATQTAFRTLKISSVWRRASDRAPFSMLKGLLHRYMLPTTLYGSALFTDNVGRSLDIYMNQVLRKATRSHNSTNTTLLSEFTGTIRPTVRIQQETVSVLSRMLDNSSSHVREAVNTQFNLGLPFATKARKLLESLSDFPICGQPLIRRLDNILLDIEDREERPSSPFPPFIPNLPSHNHFIAFTDGSTTESQTSGCSTVILVGNNIITSSFALPDIKENNAAEISAVVHLLEQITTLKSTTFPDIDSGTLITDSLNTVNALFGTSLLRDSSFIACLHSIRKLLRSLRITLTVKWVKAHDEEHSSPFNEVADLWSGRSIEDGIPLTSTTIMKPSDIADAIRPIPWHLSEIPPTSLAADVAAFKSIANSAILLTEDARYRNTLQRYIHPQLINFPGTGSSIVKKATVPNAHWLLHLRRDPTAHFSEHQALNKFNSLCPCCSSDTLPTHSHLLQECALDKLSKRDFKKFTRSRQFILSLYSPPVPPLNDFIDAQDLQRFLVHLTSNSWHDVTIANEIVQNTAAIFKIFHARRNSAPPTAEPDIDSDSSDDDAPLVGPGSSRDPVIQASYHTSREARLLILDRLEDCRTATEFDACLTHYNKELSLIVKWARKENRPFYKPNFHRQWLHRIEHYVTIFNLPTHKLRHSTYRMWESQDRAFASNSSLLPTPPSRFTGKRKVHDDIPGWIPRMNKISKLLRHSLLRNTPVSILDATRPERRTSRNRAPQAAHHRRVASPAWAFSLNWSMQASSPLVEAWFAAPTSIDQRNMIGPAWPASWPKTSVITTRNKVDAALYDRNTIANSKEGPPLTFLFDLIRGALASGEITTDPPFPLHTATAQAKKDQGTSTKWFVPFEAAAVTLIFTPIEILRQRYTFTINPLNSTRNCDFPPDITPFPPRLDTFLRVQQSILLPETDAIRAAHDWALDQMSHGRTYLSTEFPATPADIPGPPTDESDPDTNSDFDGIVTASSDDDSNDSNDEQLPPSPAARNLSGPAPASARAQQPRHRTQHPQDRPSMPTSTSKHRRK
jgi:ribonuclease HI